MWESLRAREVTISCTIRQKPSALPWGRAPQLDFGVKRPQYHHRCLCGQASYTTQEEEDQEDNQYAFPCLINVACHRHGQSKDETLDSRLPTINGTALTGEEQKVWKNFTRMNRKVEARPCVSFPMDKYLIRVKETDPVVKFIVDFAVDAFNDSYMYVKEHGSKNITEAVPLVCEYYKLSSKYCFYVTLDAIEQGKPGLYKAAVDCDCGSGARTLCKFALTDLKTKYNGVSAVAFSLIMLKQLEGRREEILRRDVRSFDQESEYEKAWSSDESEPEDFYDISGMVHRMATTGGGFNYQNPSSTLHRYILNDGRNRMYRGVEV
ncbi:hypothetical protein Tco_0962329 [Tanacetum coccineum]